jgi:hypothetical protein
LWRYLIGDTVRFIIKSVPHWVTGRTKHHINVFGEELMVENTDQAIASSVTNPNGSVDYTVAPIFMEGKVHEWMIEFKILLQMYHNSRKH